MAMTQGSCHLESPFSFRPDRARTPGERIRHSNCERSNHEIFLQSDHPVLCVRLCPIGQCTERHPWEWKKPCPPGRSYRTAMEFSRISTRIRPRITPVAAPPHATCPAVRYDTDEKGHRAFEDGQPSSTYGGGQHQDHESLVSGFDGIQYLRSEER